MSDIEPIVAGQKLPTVRLQRLENGHIQNVLTDELLVGERTLILGFPGAFTPICEGVHLPGYLKRIDDIRAKGVSNVVAVTVNDPWVTAIWEKHLGCAEQIPIYSDGNAEFAEMLGLKFEAPEFGIGVRSHRYSIVVRNGIVDHVNVDRGMEVCRVTSARVMLDAI